MSPLHDDILAFERMKSELADRHDGEWVVFYRGDFVGAYSSFQAAAEDAEERFDADPCLIRQVGAGPIHLTAATVFRPANAADLRGI